jgi:hypothetical protein
LTTARWQIPNAGPAAPPWSPVFEAPERHQKREGKSERERENAMQPEKRESDRAKRETIRNTKE